MSLIKIKASYRVGNSSKLETVVEVSNATKGEVEEAIARQQQMDVRHIQDTRVQVIK